ncbi:MAG TPA: VF530 family protein [Agitococcus sp.]|nr:VF530 family protein [Agitococcus sp.]
MTKTHQDPLHGLTLKIIIERLVALYGWQELARFIDINCFKNEPSVKSSLVFLRRTPWARQQVEDFYVRFGHDEWLKNPPVTSEGKSS